MNEHLYDSYDTLPNLKLKSDENCKIEDNIKRPKHLILCISNEHLPFIDSTEVSSTTAPGCSSRYHNERIIQMMPRNLIQHDRHNSINNWERLAAMQQKLTTHKYIEIDVMDSQICQKCHKVLSFKKTYKCTLCDYTCHQHCAADKVSSIYCLIFSFNSVVSG